MARQHSEAHAEFRPDALCDAENHCAGEGAPQRSQPPMTTASKA